MDFLNNIDFSSGTDWFGSAADAVSDTASGFMDSVDTGGSDGWFSGGLDFVTGGASKAFGWLGNNPEAANLLGGVAKGAGAYLSAKEAADREDERYKRQRRDAMINPGELGDYGSYRSVAGRGLLTNGALAGMEERK